MAAEKSVLTIRLQITKFDEDTVNLARAVTVQTGKRQLRMVHDRCGNGPRSLLQSFALSPHAAAAQPLHVGFELPAAYCAMQSI